jgi:magnesium transporter
MLHAYHHRGDRLATAELVEGSLPVWLDLLNPTAEEDKRVEDLLGISLPTREEMHEIEVSARLYNEAGAEFMTILAVTRIETDDPLLTPITFILKGSSLVTVRYEETRAFSTFAARALKPGAVACSTGEQVMLSLIDSLSDRIADALERTAADIDNISREVFRKRRIAGEPEKARDLEGLLEKIGIDGDLLTTLRESLVSVNRLLTFHTTIEQNDRKAGKEVKARAKTLYRDVVALTDQTAFLSNKVNFLLDATLGLISLQQNQIIKIFSVAAVVFLPPTLVASIYGMNFDYMPELKWMAGYPFALGLMILSAILPYWYFKRRGWL